MSIIIRTLAAGGVTQPALSNVTAFAAATTATLNFSTNKAGGAGHWVLTTSSQQPNVTQIVNGQDHTGAVATSFDMQLVTEAGAQLPQEATGLTVEATYYFHLVYRDGDQTPSTIESASVTTSNVSVAINVRNRSALELAPESMLFEALVSGFDATGPSGGVYDDRRHEIEYFWDFGDPGTFTAPVNTLPEHKNSGVAYGPDASHTFRAAGTYNVSVMAYERSSGRVAMGLLSVTVGAASASYTDVTVNTAGGANYTSLDSALQDVRGNQNTPTRIILEAGQTFTWSGLAAGQNSSGVLPSLQIVSSNPAGAKPTIDVTGSIFWDDVASGGLQKDFVCQDLNFVGPWDSTTETGASLEPLWLFSNPPEMTLFDRCDFAGFRHAYRVEMDNAFAAFTVMNDCIVTNWQEYAAYLNDGIHCLTGNRFQQHVDAISGGDRDNFTHNTQGCLRFPRAIRTVIDANDMFSRTGWFLNDGFRVTQEPIRWNTNGELGAYLTCTRNGVEGGEHLIAVATANSGIASNPCNVVIEMNYLLANAHTKHGIRTQFGGTTVRNNIMVFPSNEHFRFYEGLGFVRIDVTGSQLNGNASEQVNVYSNTLVNNLTENDNFLNNQTSVDMVSNQAGFTNVAIANNLNYQPNFANTADGNLSTGSLWEPRYKGYKASAASAFDTTYATPTNAAHEAKPQTGSAALGDATSGLVAYRDIIGNVRPANADRGAWQVSA